MTASKIVLLGAGNVATHLGRALVAQGHQLLQVYSRTEASASCLAQTLHSSYTTDISQLAPSADVYLCCLKDDVLASVLAQVSHFGNALWLHTSGSLSMSVFSPYTERYGVFYPLQTFSKQRELSLAHVPFCVEAHREEDLRWIKQLASTLSDDVREMNSKQRQSVHVAAVFACNFTNSLYAMAQEILAHDEVDFSILQSLIEETAAKVRRASPCEVQTGPAVRMDRQVMDKHIDWLRAHHEDEKAELYENMSRLIHQRSLRQNSRHQNNQKN